VEGIHGRTNKPNKQTNKQTNATEQWPKNRGGPLDGAEEQRKVETNQTIQTNESRAGPKDGDLWLKKTPRLN
jgi:hypothetical protein